MTSLRRDTVATIPVDGLALVDGLLEGQTAHAVSVAEKGLLWVRMVAEGRAGHGSTPYPGEAPNRLLEAMNRVARYRSRPRIDPAVYQLLHAAGHDDPQANSKLTTAELADILWDAAEDVVKGRSYSSLLTELW